ncbi:MAG: hypothetical protein NTX50_00820 [Candidatus Sumerlaeota bacterium]|nr:hypothetical protein [Candidatus Sumerlaeota bacterium]
MSLPDRLTVITHRYAGTAMDQVLLDAASFYGINSETLDMDVVSLREALKALASQARPCAAIAASTLVHLQRDDRLRLKRYFERTEHSILLIHSIHAQVARGMEWLEEFLDAEIALIPTPADRPLPCCFTRKRPEWTGPLTGAAIGKTDPARDASLIVKRREALPFAILTPGAPKTGGEMIFGHCRLGDGSVYILCAPPPDAGDAGAGLAAWLTPARVTRLLPAMVFLRGVFGASCWTHPRPRAAFIWSDARLTPRPHDVELRAVAEAALIHEQHVVLAVPPREYARFDPVAAKLLRQYLNHLSVAPYGNDGQLCELETSSSLAPQGVAPAAQAMRRMTEFGQRAKAIWSKVMVAPGERWHPSQARDLQRYGFRMLLGQPATRPERSPFKAHEGLEPASLDAAAAEEYGAEPPIPILPILQGEGAEQAVINAFLGRPILLALRPEWFGAAETGAAPSLMDQMASLDFKPVWADLDKISQSLYMTRRCLTWGTGGAVTEVRMFASEVIVEGINLSQEQVEVIPPHSPLCGMERVRLEGALEGKWLACQAGRLMYEILGQTALRVCLRREIPNLNEIPLGGPRLGLLGHASRLLGSLTQRFRRTAT